MTNTLDRLPKLFENPLKFNETPQYLDKSGRKWFGRVGGKRF